jgi:hypothetical protein
MLGYASLGYALATPPNTTILSLKGFLGRNTQAYYEHLQPTAVKSFTTLAAGRPGHHGGFEGGGEFGPSSGFDSFDNMNLANFFGDRHDEILGGGGFQSETTPAKVRRRWPV